MNSIDGIGFNGVKMIAEKTQLALEHCGGVMIWEAGEEICFDRYDFLILFCSGQDCRLEAVNRDGQHHKVTCPHPRFSLLKAIHNVINQRDEL